ncbi:hypothetical protein L1280_000793 [Deinococcus sp. HSC-46F16]|uniref:hypothetical protein n=1 Tax=Deinococcus sp. HSC-46F16 TaxID=2910968 RepID=UPI00209E8313|nr:hypothetical protein [Deinococcus sp. HSC-46F16]MCP2013665.1 hypothetical protein [Deinococcus sp. HSC-46F16]
MRKLGALTALSLILASCGGGPERVPDNAPPETTVSGRIQTWQSGAAGTVTLQPGLLPLATAPVSSTGTFALTLPTGPLVEAQTRPIPETLEQGLSDLNCTSAGLTVSDPAARGLLFFTLRAEGGGAGVREVAAASLTRSGPLSASFDARAWLYTDRVVTVTGRINCRVAGLTAPINVNVKTVPGWIKLQISATGSYGFGGASAGGKVSRTLTDLNTWLTLDEVGQALQ